MPDSATAVQPDISLGVKVPQPSGFGIDGLSTLANTLNAVNQNRLFQQTFSARQRAGELLATSNPSDPESGIKALLGDPQTAGFAPEIINSLRAAEQAQVGIQGAQQEQSQAGLAGFMKSLPAVLADPGQWQSMVSSQLSTLSPTARARVAPAIESIRQGLIAGLPSDPAQARAMFNNRLAGVLYSAMGPAATDAIRGTLGTPTTVNTGGATNPMMQLPPQLGGGMSPAGTPIPNTLAPQIPTLPGGIPGQPIGGAYGTGGATSPSSSSSGASPSVPGAPSLAPAAAVVSSPFTPATVGSPLYDPNRDGSSPNAGVGLGGLKVQSPQQLELSKNLANEFATTGTREFNNQNSSLAYLTYMDNAYDNLAKGGGFQQPGTAAEFRNNFAKAVNTLAQIAGTDPSKLPFDPTKVASAEEFNKQTNILGTQILTTMLGNQREAAQTISKFTSSVPGISNTYLGGKLLIDTYQAAMQRGIDQRNFENAWQASPANQGSLVGASEAFNKQYPAESYANKVLGNHGLSASGFTSFGAIENAVKTGLITPAQASAIAKQQGLGPAGATPKQSSSALQPQGTAGSADIP